MQLSILQIIAIGATLLLIGAIVGRFLRKSEGEGFFSRIFKDGKDFDSTLDRVGINTVLIFMLWAFHDDFADPARAATVIILFQAVFNLYGQITVGKAIKEMANGNAEVKTFEPEDKAGTKAA